MEASQNLNPKPYRPIRKVDLASAGGNTSSSRNKGKLRTINARHRALFNEFGVNFRGFNGGP